MAHPRQWKVAKTKPTPAAEQARLAEVEALKYKGPIRTTDWERIEMMKLARRRPRA